MFPRNLVFSVWLGVVLLATAANWGCTRNPTKIGLPQAPVAVPTANATPPGEGEQGTRNESEPAIPFDGSRPEVISTPPRGQTDPLEKSTPLTDIYAELTGQSLTCEEARP